MKVSTEAVTTHIGILVSCLSEPKLDVPIRVCVRMHTHALLKTHTSQGDLFSSETISDTFTDLGFIDKFT